MGRGSSIGGNRASRSSGSVPSIRSAAPNREWQRRDDAQSEGRVAWITSSRGAAAPRRSLKAKGEAGRRR
jgi:hypothetical protein